MRISDWSSDVCSSDLGQAGGTGIAELVPDGGLRTHVDAAGGVGGDEHLRLGFHLPADDQLLLVAAGERVGGHLDPGRAHVVVGHDGLRRSEEHTSELQSLMRISYAVFCLKKKKNQYTA